MFTGIIEEVGSIKKIKRLNNAMQLDIQANKVLEATKMGDSIAVNGICLTVTALSANSFSVDVSHETVKRSSINTISLKDRVNLERAMHIDSRFGGHIVSGHIDGTGQVKQIINDGIAINYTIEVNQQLTSYIVEKGSITIDGISLTVTSIRNNLLSVSVIPHTQLQTNLKDRHIGDLVNIEVDVIAKYVEKLVDSYQQSLNVKSLLSKGV